MTYFVTGAGYPGNIIMAEYNKEWNYLGMKTILQNGTWSEGSSFDGRHFYVAYVYTSHHMGQDYIFDIHLAVLDRDWNLVNDTAVTHYTVDDNIQVWRPWILLLGNKLYAHMTLTRSILSIMLKNSIRWKRISPGIM